MPFKSARLEKYLTARVPSVLVEGVVALLVERRLAIALALCLLALAIHLLPLAILPLPLAVLLLTLAILIAPRAHVERRQHDWTRAHRDPARIGTRPHGT